MMKFKPWMFLLSCSFVTMIGCTTQSSSHEMGPVLSDEDLNNIHPDTTKQDIIDQYGQPSFRCFTPGNHNLCYFHQTKKNDVITEQRQVEIEFDEEGKIKEIRIYEPLNPETSTKNTSSHLKKSS